MVLERTTKARTPRQLLAEIEQLERQLEATRGILRAIQNGETDALLVPGSGGNPVYLANGADRAFRTMVEEMNEGTLTLSGEGMLVLCNRCFAEMVHTSLEQLVGESFLGLLAPEDRSPLEQWLQSGLDSFKREVTLAGTGPEPVRVLLSLRGIHLGGMRYFSGLAVDITAQKRTEALLSYQTQLLANVHDAIFATNEQYAITFWNSAAQDLYGWTAEKVIGRDIQEVLRTELPETQRADLRRRIAENGHVHSRVIQFRKDDTPVYVEEITIALRDAEGSITGFVSADRDISEQKQTEEALRASEERFRLAVDNFPGVFIIYDGERRIQFINMPGMILSGLPENGLLGHTDEQVFPPEVTSAYLPLLRRAIETGTVQTGEVEVTWPAGTFAETVTYVPLLDEYGGIRQILGVAEDITERKHAEQALIHQTDTLRGQAELLNLTHDAILVRDVRGVLTFWNHGAEEMYGWAQPQALGQVAHLLLHTQYPGSREQVESEVRQTGWWEGELVHTRRDGTRIVVASRWALQRDEQGHPLAILEINNNVTERKRAEEALRRLNAELEQRVAERTGQLETTNQELKNEIVEHAHTENALRKSEQQFRLLAENAQDLIYRITVTPERAFEYISPSASQITGYTPEEYYADPDLGFRLVTAEDRPALEAAMRGQIASGAPLVLRLVRRDGALIWTEQRVSPILNAAGEMVALEGIARDITERRQAEEALRLSEERFRIALKNAPITVTSQDRELRYTWFYNPMAADDTDKFLGKLESEVLPPEEAARLAKIKKAVMESGMGAHQEGWLTLDGEPHFYDFTVEPLRDAAGVTVGVTTVAVNITERKRAEDALEHANENLMVWASELEHRNHEMSQLNEMGNLLESCLSAEEAYEVITHSARILFPEDSGALYVINSSKNLVEGVASWGDPRGDLAGQVFSPDDCWSLRRGRTHVVEHSQVGLLCAHVHRDLGKVPPFAYLCVPMLAQGETLGVFFLQSGVLDTNPSKGERSVLTEAKERLAVSIAEHVALALSSLRLRETLRRQAIRDPLTGLFNRRYMEESLERELRRATRRKSTVGIIMLDLDHFKHFNDAFGHEVGDAILRAFGSFLIAHVRGGDIACRYGGEEFTLILPETSLHEMQERAEQMRQEIKQIDVNFNGHSFGNLSASLGVAIFPEQGETADAILRAADVALYRAKSEGRDRVFTSEGLD